MLYVMSTLFCVLCFLHQGKIITVDQLSFFASTSFEGNVPYVDHTTMPYESAGAGIFKESALMGLFSLPPRNTAQVNMISTSSDPWIIPSPDQVDSFGDVMPLSPVEVNYSEIVSYLANHTEHATSSMYFDAYFQSPLLCSLNSSNPLNETFPSNESIMETMSLEETPWNDIHHRSSFLPSHGVAQSCHEDLAPIFHVTRSQLRGRPMRSFLKGTWAVLLRLCLSIFLWNYDLSRIFILGLLALQMRSSSILVSFNNFEMFFYGPMRKCLASARV